MLNTVTVTIAANVPLLPSTKLTMSGFGEFGQGLEKPSINVDLPGNPLLNVLEWDASRGIVVLQLLPGARFAANEQIIFALDIMMPKEAPTRAAMISSEPAIRASGAGQDGDLCLKEIGLYSQTGDAAGSAGGSSGAGGGATGAGLTVNGEAACQVQGRGEGTQPVELTQTECEAVGCCQWNQDTDDGQGACWSNVGTDVCGTNLRRTRIPDPSRPGAPFRRILEHDEVQECLTSFIVKSIGQTSCTPSACNTFTVTMAVNRALSEEQDNAMIVLMGFHDGVYFAADCQNTTSPSSCGSMMTRNISLGDGREGSNDRNLFQNLAGIAGHATWDASTQSLKMLLARKARLLPFESYVITFNLKNGPQHDTGMLHIAAFNGDGQCLTFPPGSGPGVDSCYDEMLSPVTGFGVCRPEFTKARISQTSSLPGCNGQRNNVTIMLETNIALKAPWTITVMGLNVHDVDHLPSLIEAAHSISTGAFKFNSSTTLQASTPYTFTFSVVNTASLEDTLYNAGALRVESGQMNATLEHDTVMQVDGIVLTARAYQSTPYPSALNTIFFAIEANVALPVGAKLSLSGLKQGLNVSAGLSEYNALGPFLADSGQWDSQVGKFVINVTSRVEAGTYLNASFDIVNPDQETEPTQMQLLVTCDENCDANSCPMPIGPVSVENPYDEESDSFEFEFDCRKCLQHPCIECGKSCTGIDANVLQTHTPGLILKHVSQTSDWPLANNTVHIHLAYNVDITAPVVLTLAGFSDLDHDQVSLNLIACNDDFSASCAATFKSITWDNDRKGFELHVGDTSIIAGTIYKLSFDLVNPSCQRHSPVLVLSSSDLSKCGMDNTKCVMETGWDQQFYVARPGFLNASIVQSTTLPSAINTLRVTLSFNVPRTRGSLITISGLTQSATADNSNLAVVSADGVAASAGSWTRQSGTLVVSLANYVEAGSEASFSFDLENPKFEKGGVTVTASSQCDSCHTGVARAIMSSPKVSGVDVGDQIPLTVRTYHLTKFMIGQDSALPKTENVICVTLAVSSNIPVEQKLAITLGNFIGAQAPDGLMVVHDGENATKGLSIRSEASGGITGAGLWNNSQKTLRFVLDKGMAALEDNIFCFSVTNPSFAQEAVDITIDLRAAITWAEECAKCAPRLMASLVSKILECDMNAAAGTFLPSALPGDACPMKVYAPEFLRKTITECSDIPSYMNTLSIELSATVDLPSGCSITIAGLVGSSSGAEAVKVDSEDLLFEKVAWSNSTGTLVLTIATGQSVAARDVVFFKVGLQNPARAQLPVRPTIRAYVPDVGRISPSAMSGAVLGASGHPSLTVMAVSESSSVQGSFNVIMVILELNAALDAGSMVTISGLTGTISEDTELSGTHVHQFSNQYAWDHQHGYLVLTSAEDIPAKTKRMFSFSVINGYQQQAPPEVVIRIHPRGECAEYYHGDVTAAMVGTVLTMETPVSYVAKRVGQSSPYPSVRNVITVTLGYNLDHRHQISSREQVFISGLHGAHASVGPMLLLGSHPFGKGCWGCSCRVEDADCTNYETIDEGTLSFHIEGDMAPGSHSVFSFEIVNPAQGQDAKVLTVSYCAGTGDCIVAELEGDSITVPKRTLKAVSGEAMPLFVRSLMFPIATISQDNSYPCELNTLCVTLSLSVPVQQYEDFSITLSGLDNANHDDGDIAIFSPRDASSVTEFQSTNGTRSAATWSSAQETLTLQATCHLDADTLYSFCFRVTNPSGPQLPPDIYIESPLVDAIMMKKSFRPIPFLFPYQGAAPDSQAMYVRDAQFESFDTASNSTQICHPNKLTFSFRMNLPMDETCDVKSITITGIVGVSDAAGDVSLLNESSAAASFRDVGTWHLNGSLILSLKENARISAGEQVKFSIVMRNGPIAQAAPSDIIVASGDFHRVGTWDPVFPKPLTIADGATLTANIEQSMSWPQATNKLQASFSVDADVGGFTPVILEISDLISAQAPAQIPVGFVNGGIACSAHTNRTFIMFSMMDVRQRTQDEAADYNADHFLCVTYDEGASEWKFSNGTGWAALGEPVPSDFLLATVDYGTKNVSLIAYDSNESDWKGMQKGFNLARSDLEFEFAPTMQDMGSPLKGEAGFDTGKIRVLGRFFQPFALAYGLTKTVGDTVSHVACESVTFESDETKGNVLSLTLAAGTILEGSARYSLWFLVANPQHQQDAVNLTLAVSTECVALTTTMSSEMGALRVEAASFLSYNAVQTSPFPCSSNTITVSFMTNVFIRHENGAALHISGFSGAIVGTEMLQLVDASLQARDDNDVFATQGIWDDGTDTGIRLEGSASTWAQLPEDSGSKLKFGTTSFAIEMQVKVKAEAISGGAILISNKAASSSVYYAVQLTGSSWKLVLSDSAEAVEVIGNDINDGVWHHVACVVDRESNEVRLYQDAVLIKEQAVSVGSVTRSGDNSISIGGSPAESDLAHADTYITDIRVWGAPNAPLTQTFFEGRIRSMPLCLTQTETHPLLVAELRFKEPSGTNMLDSAPGHYHDGSVPEDIRWRETGARNPGLTLCLEEGSTLEAGIEYRIAFEISNPIIQASSATDILEPMDRLGNTKTPASWSYSTTQIESYGGVQMVALSATPTDANLGLCGLETEADANPMFLYEPVFTKATVYQSTHYPCYDNELSVVLKTNVPLCAKSCISQITISQLSGAEADSGPIDLRPFDTFSDHHLTFSDAPRGKGGRGLWSDVDKTLVLFMTCCMECNKEYRFRFTIRNPGCPQAGNHLTVEATNADNLVAIARTNMTWLNASNLPMYTQEPEFMQTTIVFGTNIPCGDNNVDIMLTMNVPLFPGIAFTVLGLPTDEDEDSDLLLSFTSSPCYDSTAPFNGTSKSMILTTVRDIAVNESCYFTFNMTNAVKNSESFVFVETRLCADCLTTKDLGSAKNLFQDRVNLTYSSIQQSNENPCANNTITVKFQNVFPIHKNCNPLLTLRGLVNTRTHHSSVVVRDLFNGGEHVSEWDQTTGSLLLSLNDFIEDSLVQAKRFEFEFDVTNPPKEQDCVETLGTLKLLDEYSNFTLRPEVNPYKICPLHVKRVNFVLAEISQNHSIPCTKVSVQAKFATNTPLLTECPQTVRICGLDESTTAPTSISEDTGTWVFDGFNESTKCLSLKLAADTVANVTYNVSFDLTHGAGISTGLDNVMIISDFFSTQKTMDVACVPASTCTPMAVSAFNFTGALSGQTSRIPCNDNTIIVSLSVNMPIFCDLSVTFSNVSGTDGMPSNLRVYFSAPAAYSAVGVVGTRADSSEEVSAEILANVGAAGRQDTENLQIVFNFTVFNQREAREPESVVALEAVFSTPDDGDSGQQTLKQMEFAALAPSFRSTGPTGEDVTFMNKGLVVVKDINFTRFEIEQSNPYPCAVNTISVTLAFDTELKLRCQPQITLKGLTGSYTPDSNISLQNNKNDMFQATGAWVKDSGEFTVVMVKGAAVEQELVFSFELVNPSTAHPAVTVQARAWSSWQTMVTNATYRELSGIYQHNTTYRDNGEHFPLHVRGLLFEIKHLGQSNPHPGCINVIAVTLQVNIPLGITTYCHPKFVISPLSNAERETGRILLNAVSGQCAASANSDMLFKESAVNGVSGYGTWNDESDKLSLWSANQMMPGQPYTFSFQVKNPMTGPGTNLSSGQEAPNVHISSAFDTGYPDGSKDGIPSYADTTMTLNSASAPSPASVLMTHDTGSPCCLCDIEEGDAAPLRVKVPTFCVKRIGQSTSNPCQINTLTVTFAPTSKLLAGDSVISLSKMEGVLSEVESQTLMKLSDGTFGQEHNLYFSNAFAGDEGYGDWSQDDAKLKLYLIKDIECGSDVVISFDILNPSDCSIGPITVQIEAESLAGKAPIILPSDMHNDIYSIPADGNRGDAAPLKLNCVTMQGTIRQSTVLPCEVDNTIHVALTLNRPLALTCVPSITIVGLLGADCPASAHISINETSGLLNQTAEWNLDTGTLVVRPVADLLNGVNFSFTLTNPARGQPANPEIKMDLLSSNWAARAAGSDFVMLDDVGLSLPAGFDATLYPLFVENAKLTVSEIGQRSPFLCDLNAITIHLTSNVTLKHCETIITVDGFANTQSPSVIHGNGVNLSNIDFTWTLPPKLTVDLEPFKAAAAATGSDTDFWISFNLTNPNVRPTDLDSVHWDSTAGCPDIILSASKKSCSDAVERLDHAALVYSDQWLDIQNMISGEEQPQTNDHRPLCFRPMTIDGEAVQNQANPCQQSTRITVSLTPSVPLFPRCMPAITITGLSPTCSSGSEVEVRSRDTVWGQTNGSSTTWTNALITGGWSQVLTAAWSSGTLTLQTGIFDTVIPGQHKLEFAFFLKRGTDSSTGVTLMEATLSSYNGVDLATATLSLPSASDPSRPLYVESIDIDSAQISQSSSVPCANSSVTVSFTLSETIDTICHPSVTISGLTGKLTETGGIFVKVTPKDPASSMQRLSGAWDKQAGTLILAPGVFMPQGSTDPDPVYEYKPDADSARVSPGWMFAATKQWQFEFDVVHPQSDDQEKSYTIEINLAGACQDKNLTKAMSVIGSSLAVEAANFKLKDIGQSNPCPCSENTITVTIMTTQPLFVACAPVITIQGLVGSQTPDDSALAVAEESGTSVIETSGKWQRDIGRLMIALDSNLDANTSVVFSFQLQNQAAPQAAPHISIEIGPKFIPSTGMVRDGASSPEPPAVIDTQAGDALPMKIWALRYVDKTIGQSTPFPGCINTITVTLGFNCPLMASCPTYMRISNLVDNSTIAHDPSLVTTEQKVQGFQSPSGKLSLTGMQHLVVNPTRTEQWWAPGLCGESRVSSNDWCEACEPVNGNCTVECSPGYGYWEDGYIDCLHVLPSERGWSISLDDDGYNHQYGGADFAASYNGTNQCMDISDPGQDYTSGGKIALTDPTGQDVGQGLFTVNRRLTLWLARTLDSNTSHVFQFQITNPMRQQRSPEIFIEGKIQDSISTHQYVQDSTLAKSSTAQAGGKAGKCGSCVNDYSVPMDKDNTTVLCCTSCAYAGNAVSASSDGTRSFGAPDGQMTQQGDAEPLKVHTPFFCTKTIGQSTPYPCMNNTLTVTIMSNTYFTQDETILTICGLESAHAESGPMVLYDGFAGCGHRHLFSYEHGGPSGFGHWDDIAKCLTLFVVKDTDCVTEYVFSFIVSNMKTYQESPDIQIGASFVANSKDVYEDGISIGMVSMDGECPCRCLQSRVIVNSLVMFGA